MRPALSVRTPACSVGLVLLFAAAPLLQAPPARAAAAERCIVVLSDGAPSGPAAADLAARHGLGVTNVYGSALQGFAAYVPPGRLRALAQDPRVRAVFPDQVIQLDPRVAGKPPKGGGGTTQPAQVTPSGISRIGGPVAGPVNADIAILDTGVDTSHPDLNVVGGVNFATGKSYKDGNGHGTHVAGTAAALDNSIGVVGAAPGARLWAVRVLDNNGSGWLSWVIAGVDWVVANASTIEVANMSLGGSAYQPLDDAVQKAISAGVVFAVAAGNSSADASTTSPARAPDALTVSALNQSNDTFASFSNFGAVIDLIAPGVNVYSTFKGGGYQTYSGTSMASPHVAGAAALYRSLYPAADPAGVRAGLLAAAEAGTWSGDPDGIAEPLVRVNGL